MEKSQPLVIIAENQSSVWSGEVELFNAENVVGRDYDKTGKTEIYTQKYKNQSTLPIQQSSSQYGGNPYVQFDIGDDGATFETGKIVTIKVNGEEKKGVVQEYNDGNGNIIRGFGNPYLFNSTLYQDNGLDYFAFYEGEEEEKANIIRGHSTTGDDVTLSVYHDGTQSKITVQCDSEGNWEYDFEDWNVTRILMGNNTFDSVDFTDMDFSTITSLEQMLRDCENLYFVNFGNVQNTANIINAAAIFTGCKKLVSVTFPLDFCPNATNIYEMFVCLYGNNAMQTMDITNIKAKVSATNGMFMGCQSLKNVTFPNGLINETTTNIRYMFDDCPLLTELDLTEQDLSNVTTYNSFVPNVSTLTIQYNPNKINNDIISAFSNVNWVAVS